MGLSEVVYRSTCRQATAAASITPARAGQIGEPPLRGLELAGEELALARWSSSAKVSSYLRAQRFSKSSPPAAKYLRAEA